MENILLIDDDEMVRGAVGKILENAGYKVFSLPDGKGAQKILKLEKIDLIITDIVMPGKDGIALIKEFKKKYDDIKIIAISGGDRKWAEDVYLGHAKHLGAHGILEKPFKKDELLTLVNKLLRQ